MKYKTFDEIIKLQNVLNHESAIKLESGSFHVEKEYISDFSRLFRPPGLPKNVGNGEVALYWILSNQYGGKHDVERQDGNDTADLLVNGIPLEIKSWNIDILSGQRVKVGRYESIRPIRETIGVVLAAHNLYRPVKKPLLSESRFTVEELAFAFEIAIKLKNKDHYVVDCALDNPIYYGLVDPLDYAAKTFGQLAASKLTKKVGARNYIANMRSDKIGAIDIIKLGDLNSFDFEKIKNGGARVHCSELFIDLSAFQDKNDKRAPMEEV